MILKIRIAHLIAFAAIAISGSAAAAEYALKAKYKIGGDGGWDYLTYDAPSNRLFVARATRVQVVDPDHGTLLAEIPDTPGVHGVALANDLGKGYTSNGRDNSVTVFDLNTLKTLAKIMTTGGENPDFIAYDAVSRRILTFNGRSHNASVIDTASDKLVATIALTGKPEAAVADGKGMIFVNIEDKNEITAIDTRKQAVAAIWPLAGCNEPAGLAIDTQARRLFVGCHNKLMVILNADSGKVVTTLPIGEGVDANAFDAETKQAFSSQGDGTLTIIKEETADRFSVQQTTSTQRGARTMALNPKNHDIYLVSAEYDEAPAAEGLQRPRRTIKPGTFTLIVMSEK
jgi:DNA-binding beta-propeller fold protein YncE